MSDDKSVLGTLMVEFDEVAGEFIFRPYRPEVDGFPYAREYQTNNDDARPRIMRTVCVLGKDDPAPLDENVIVLRDGESMVGDSAINRITIHRNDGSIDYIPGESR